ncbi:hypothetical protein PBI_MOSMORIS_96 [Mycobacterium phage MosMoris]|uniref:DUF932 domain-containing protein n=3 Tax=Marvinvirus TaxID=1982091 RepID=A0A023ZYA3_9CAUD|nr:hypothetical protein FH33_gp096 [Mycobacterium phage MosMoris]AHY84170.1 hypothetical protein PBI_MOSMORIS_96 [Mycobacterium phage MosMoris]ANM46321.1 hypothetical protein SEA_GATTACA_99 [Mycobacterium phage Gattaca]QFP94236.1 hypothetical protein SEA_JOIEB_101 [Mycobacterium phage JoieB]
MTKELMIDLNTQTLIGMVDERGSAWHRRDDLQEESNHYPRFIPVADVMRRLFNWHPQTVDVAYLVPVPEGTLFDNRTMVMVNGDVFRVVKSQQGRVGVLRDDNDYDLGVFKSGVHHPPYQVTLIERVEALMGTQLGISSAGVLSKGGRAWVEMSLPETMVNTKAGYAYRPNFVAATSMDGSLAHTDALTVTATVCDNTLTWNLLEAREAGRLFKRKHTAMSMHDLQEERDVLGLLERVDEEFNHELESLIDIELTRQERIHVMDIIAPLPKDEGRAYTLAENKRARLVALDEDPMVSQWIGTALGEVQRYNTFEHHYSSIKGSGRSERNTWRALSGKQTAADKQVIAAIEKVVAAR